MKTAAAYIRVSTEDQIEYSPDSQIKKIKEYAKHNDIFIDDELVFLDEGISGRKAEKRPEFMRMIALAKTKPRPFDVILVWKFSRFARNREDSIVYKSMLRKQCGIDVVSVSEQIGEDKTSILIEALLEAMDEYYSINLAEEVKRGMLEKVSRGEVVTPPSFGYTVENNVYIPHPEEAPIISRIFNSYLTGNGLRTIARTLGAEGVRTKRGNLPDNRFVEYILRNPVYIGKIRWSKEGRAASTRDYTNENIIIVDGKHQPLVDLDTWNAVQDKLDAQKKAYGKHQRKEQTVDFMLKGLVRCSSCGATLTHAARNVGIQCHNFARGTCKVSHYISLAKINKAVIEALESSIEHMSFDIKPKSRTSPANGPDVNKLIANEERKLERVRAAYENGVDTLEEYKTNKSKILATIRKLEAERPQAQESFDKKSYAKKVSSVLAILKSDASEKTKNEALRTIIDHIIFNRTETTIDIVFYV